MANKRMFSLNVVDTDRFLEMPVSARLLYYELGMRADDDGFVDNWKKILLFTGLKEDDMKLLIAKSFLIPFESGVIVIKHWRMNNYLQSDRKKDTAYQEELKMLDISKSGEYFINKNYIIKGPDEICIQNGSNMYTQYSIDKNSIDKNNIIKEEEKQTKIRFKKPTIEEIEEYCKERNNGINANAFYDFYESKDWYVGKNKMKDWKACIRTWEQRKTQNTNQVNEKVPDWYNKELKNEEMTETEKEELDSLINEVLGEINNINI